MTAAAASGAAALPVRHGERRCDGDCGCRQSGHPAAAMGLIERLDQMRQAAASGEKPNA